MQPGVNTGKIQTCCKVYKECFICFSLFKKKRENGLRDNTMFVLVSFGQQLVNGEDQDLQDAQDDHDNGIRL